MSSDYFSYSELEALNAQIEEFKKAFVRIMRFCFNYGLFMLDDGSLFNYLISEFRRHAVMPSKREDKTPVQQQEILLVNGKLSSWAPVIIIAVTILSLTFLTIYKYLKAELAVLGITAVILIAFSPQIIIMILAGMGRSSDGEDEEQINYEEIFGEIIERYKEALMHVRVNMRTGLTEEDQKDLEDDPLTSLQKLELWKVEDLDKELKTVQTKATQTKPEFRNPYGDIFGTDEVAQSQIFFSAWVANKLGTIYNLSEKELYRRKRFILEKSADAAGAQSSQSLKARVG